MATNKPTTIDETARVHPDAVLGEGVEIGPWCIVGPNVEIGDRTQLLSHVVVRSHTRMGSDNTFYQFCSVGEDPADKKFDGEDTWLELGNDNVFREGVTLHRGTGSGGGLTRVGDNNLMMAYAHVAHDCMVGSNTVFANNVGLCGHVQIDDWVILGGYAGINQFLRIGAHAMVGGMTHVVSDIPAFMIVSGQPAGIRSINSVGLERRGFDKAQIAAIKTAFKILYKRQLSLKEALAEIREMQKEHDVLAVLIDSVESSTRGIHR